MMLFNLNKKTFSLDYLVTETQGWIEVSQDDIDGISASITGGGAVWLENGVIKYSGKAPSEYHVFNSETKTFEISQDKQAKYFASQKDAIRTKINDKRDECVNGGVFVPEINKWVDTDDKGRSTLVEIKADFDLNGKNNTYTLICADNTAQVIHFEEFKAVWNAVKTLKEKMYENAYMHKVLLEQSENPTDYNWSTGWSKTYQEHLNEQQA